MKKLFLKIKHKVKLCLIVILTIFLYLMNNVLIEKVKFIRKEYVYGRFIVHTPTCNIPNLDPFDSQIMQYVHKVISPCKNRPRLIYSNETSLIFNTDAFKEYNITELEDVICCYQDFPRIKDEKYWKYIFGDEVYFQENVEIDKEFIKVVCSSEKDVIFKDYYSFIKIKEGKNIETNRYNVLIVGLDSVSRLNFHRQLPKTIDYLKQLGAIEYFGYNKVADNAFSNKIPVLTGMNEKELTQICWPEVNMPFDNCSKYCLWQNYRDKRYVTALGEDGSGMNIFNYGKNIFKDQPVDHVYAVFDYEAQDDIGYGDGDAHICQGERFTVEYLLEYAYKFTKAYNLAKRNYFGFFWQNSVSHNTINYDSRVDQIYKEFFEKLQHLKIFRDTFVFIVSYHGVRLGDSLNTFQGRLEERLPFFAAIAPNNFKKDHPRALKNLEENSKKLTTPFDFHETLKAILDENFLTNIIKSARGYSLFQPIPLNRTCDSAGIPGHWCTCQDRTRIDTNSSIALAVTNFVISKINDLIYYHTSCALVYLDQILDAWYSKKYINEKHLKKMTYYTVVFRSVIVEAIFEATVKCRRCKGSDFVMAGNISRHNLYKHKGSCVDDARLKMFCYCIH